MVDENSAGNEINSDTTISLNLQGATVAFSDDNDDNHSESTENDGDIDCHSLQLSNSVLPPNTSVNVENSSDVIVGPVTQFHGPVTIFQNTHNNGFIPSDTTKYLTNGFKEENTSESTTISSAKLVSSETPGKSIGIVPFSKKKITLISILVIVIIVLLTVIISYSVGIFINTDKDVDNISDIRGTLNEPQIKNSRHKLIYRSRWGGRPPLYERPGKLPIKYVIISHTAGAYCDSFKKCAEQMIQIQSLHVASGSPDIGYNFLIGGDENIYVARGWDNHNFHMSFDTIGICFMGNYIYNILTPGMIEATQELLKMGVEKGKLIENFVIVPHNQTYNTQSPGPNIYNQIRFWPHYSPEILTDN